MGFKQEIASTSIFGALIGLVTIFLFLNFQSPVNVSYVNKSLLGKYVLINGSIEKIWHSNKTTFLSISTKGNKTKIVVFDKIDLPEKAEISVFGKVQLYNNELEIIASKVKCLSC